jgi:hypothetical protein
MCSGELRHTIGKLSKRATTLVQTLSDPSSGREVMNAHNPESPNRDNFGTPLWESREKEPFGCKCGEGLQRILYGGRWWLPLSPGRGESSESKVARGLS